MAIPELEQLIRRIPSSLGSYGPVLSEIEGVLQSPQCSLATIGEAIEKEPDLTARLLRLGNSSFYGFANRLTTVTEAISLIGIQQVQDLIQVSSVIEQFAGVKAEYVDMESFWRHSLACGLGARCIALERRLAKPDKFFVAGLLHDIGRLVLYSQAPNLARQVFQLYQSERLLLREAEARALGYDHQQVGEALLRYWQYPPHLMMAVGLHHTPTAAEAAQEEVAAVHVADHLVNAMHIGSSGERFVPPLARRAWEILGLSPGALAAIVDGIDEQLDAVQDVFLSRVRRK